MKSYLFKWITAATLALFAAIAILGTGHAGGDAGDTNDSSGYTPEDCITCHNLESEESGLLIDVDAYDLSIHGGEITCLECHIGVVDDDHQTTEGSGTVYCNDCHEQENQHGLAGPEDARPQCHDCHTRHDMLTKTDPASTVHRDRLITTCAGCHAAASGNSGYFAWFPSFQISSHEKADFDTAYDESNCLGCHQGAAVHGETEPIDDQNCYKCHLAPQVDGAMWGYMHPQSDVRKQPAVFAAASIHQLFIGVILIVVLGKLLDVVFDRSPGRSKR